MRLRNSRWKLSQNPPAKPPFWGGGGRVDAIPGRREEGEVLLLLFERRSIIGRGSNAFGGGGWHICNTATYSIKVIRLLGACWAVRLKRFPQSCHLQDAELHSSTQLDLIRWIRLDLGFGGGDRI